VTEMLALEKLLTAAEVGEILRVSPKTVRRLPIKSVPVGRGKRPRRAYRPTDVQRYIEESAT
jgi:phage terminase Nu1 subunit (DNA packaging protein)